MNKLRSAYIYELIGVIKSSKFKLVNNRPSYRLTVDLKNSDAKSIRAFQDKLDNPNIWQLMEENKAFAKTYIFYCQNYFGNYRLIN